MTVLQCCEDFATHLLPLLHRQTYPPTVRRCLVALFMILWMNSFRDASRSDNIILKYVGLLKCLAGILSIPSLALQSAFVSLFGTVSVISIRGVDLTTYEFPHIIEQEFIHFYLTYPIINSSNVYRFLDRALWIWNSNKWDRASIYWIVITDGTFDVSSWNHGTHIVGYKKTNKRTIHARLFLQDPYSLLWAETPNGRYINSDRLVDWLIIIWTKFNQFISVKSPPWKVFSSHLSIYL